jgi:hypothetical protein
MLDKKVICPKCNTQMERGFVPDQAHGNFTHLGYWHKGIPQKRMILPGITYSNNGRIPIGAFRCPKCGFVELYADDSFQVD